MRASPALAPPLRPAPLVGIAPAIALLADCVAATMTDPRSQRHRRHGHPPSPTPSPPLSPPPSPAPSRLHPRSPHPTQKRTGAPRALSQELLTRLSAATRRPARRPPEPARCAATARPITRGPTRPPRAGWSCQGGGARTQARRRRHERHPERRATHARRLKQEMRTSMRLLRTPAIECSPSLGFARDPSRRICSSHFPACMGGWRPAGTTKLNCGGVHHP